MTILIQIDTEINLHSIRDLEIWADSTNKASEEKGVEKLRRQQQQQQQ